MQPAISTQTRPSKISPQSAYYIKLGSNGAWERDCLADSTLRLGFYEAPHTQDSLVDRQRIRSVYEKLGRSAGTASNFANQVATFYEADNETLWITFAEGKLWWAFAAPGVEFLGSDSRIFADTGSRYRRTRDGWHSTSIDGQPLVQNDLSGSLTKTAGYRQTICQIKGAEFDYLLRVINDERLPEIKEALDVKQNLMQLTGFLITRLQPGDFELLVDLIFSANGWKRTSAIGGTAKTIDIEMSQPLTRERIMVQVKSASDQAELNSYARRFENMPQDRMFYVYHTSRTALEIADQRIVLIGRERLAELVMETGQFDWLIQKVG